MSNRNQDWTEKTRVQLPAAIHAGRLGWPYRSKEEMKWGQHPMRISLPILAASLSKINGRDVSIEQAKRIADGIEKICNHNDLGEHFLNWLRDPNQAPQGVYEDDEEPLKLVDWEHPERNDRCIATEVSFGDTSIKEDSFRCDNVKFLNGMPLFPDEVKPPDNKGSIQEEFERTEKRMSNPKLVKFFNMFQLMTFSNNMPYERGQVPMDERKAGSFYTIGNAQRTTFQLWREKEKEDLDEKLGEVSEEEIKRILEDNNAIAAYDTPEFKRNISPDTPYNSFLSSLFTLDRIMFILRYGIWFKREGDDLERHILRYPQYYAGTHLMDDVNSAGKGGVVFHGQGTGKTETAGMAAIALTEKFSKLDTLTRHFFITDRLFLARQAVQEFQAMGFDVVQVNTRKQFEKILSNISGNDEDHYTHNGKQRMYVVNTQKFTDELIGLKVENPYGLKVQNVFYIDECHRSYNSHGEYYLALMGIDYNAIYVALTGTPIISEKEKTTAKFGGYLDTYFYRESIEDGFTLPIMKAKIETSAAAEIRRNIKMANDLKRKDIYESAEFVSSCAKYVDEDFIKFRKDRNDKSVGGMLVAYSKRQAMMFQEWFAANSKLKTAIIVSDEETTPENAANEKKFKEGKLDIVIVFKMLQEGFNVKRLKRMYLLRHPKEHGLLQLIARLNRPYRNPFTGKWYRYGYLVDFADIEKDYNETIQMYLAEIAKYEGMDEEAFAQAADGILVNAEGLHDDTLAAIQTLKKKYNIDLAEDRETLRECVDMYNLDTLYNIRDLVSSILEARQEFQLAGETEYMEEINKDKMKALEGIVRNRITHENFKKNPGETLSVLDNDEIMEVIYNFAVDNEKVLNTEELDDVQEALVKKQQQQDLGDELSGLKDDMFDLLDLSGKYHEYLDEQLKEIYDKMGIGEFDVARQQIADVREQIQQGKEEDNQRVERFGGLTGFARAYYKIEHEYANLGLPQEAVDSLMDIAYRAYESIESKILIAGRDDFINAMKQAMTKIMNKEKIMIGTPPERLYKVSRFAKNGETILAWVYSNMTE